MQQHAVPRRVWLIIPAAVLIAASAVGAADRWLLATPEGAVAVKEMQAAAAALARVDKSDAAGLTVTATAAGLAVREIKTPRGEFLRVDWPDSALTGEVGSPAIPVIRKVFIAPGGVNVTVTAQYDSPIPIDASTLGGSGLIEPIQAPIAKLPGALENAEYRFDAAVYAADTDLPAERATVTEMGVVRGQRLFLLEIRPVAYNAAAKTLKFWPEIEASVRFTGTATPAPDVRSAPGLQNVVLNPDMVRAGARAAGNYVIIAGNGYDAAIASFAAAKQTQGFTVTTWPAPAGATTTAIKTYIQGLWTDPGTRPDYILLVGDTDKIPYWTGGGEGSPPTDLPYTCMDGAADWFPDIAIGRFPVRTTAQLSNVVAKTLYFENGPLADPSYLLRAVFMASSDNYTVSEGTHNWTIATYMDPNSMECDKLYCHTYNATTQQVRNCFNAGRLYGIYSGHGSETSWADGPVFTQSDVNGLLNANMYAFVCSFACVTGSYHLTECFTETWVLAANKGAAAIWGSSVNSYWTEDDVLQKRLFDVLYDDYVRELGPCFNLTRTRYAAQMGTGSTTRRYFEMYNLMGDPSMYIPEAQAALRVSPGDTLHAEGPNGGPFSPTSKVYQVRNVADYAINYEVTHNAHVDWVELSGAVTGTLPAGGTADVTVSINANALGLDNGVHTDDIYFTNTTDHVGDSVRQVLLEIGRYAFHSTDVPKPIADNTAVNSTLSVGEHFCIADVDVAVNITHTYIGDLVVSLRSPEGTTVMLHNRSGGGAANLVATYDDGGQAPDGPGALADFNNESPVGAWTLTVSDQAGGDTGTLNAWSLRVLPAGEVCPPAALDADIHTPVNTAVDITLEGASDAGNPLRFIILSLPAHGRLTDPGFGMINIVPHTLTGFGRVVRFSPTLGYNGTDAFQFKVNDGQDSAPATVSLTVGGPQVVHSYKLDTDPGWARQGQWAFGRPMGLGSYGRDPSSAHTGDNVYGYNLNGDYPNSIPQYFLTTTAMNCTGVTGAELRFWRWLGVESSTWDHASVQVSNNGTTWTTVWDHTGASVSDTSWSLMTLDISAVADDRPTVYFRWCMGPTDSSVTYPGWNIDDIEIWGLVPAPIPGDCDGDGDVDLLDFATFHSCVTGPAGGVPGGCDCVNADGDGDVDMVDFGAFQEVFSGS